MNVPNRGARVVVQVWCAFPSIVSLDSTRLTQIHTDRASTLPQVLYVEAPAGVGFSFSADRSHYHNITDAQSAHDNFLFVQVVSEVALTGCE